MPRMAQGRRPTKVREGRSVGAPPRMDGAEPNSSLAGERQSDKGTRRKRGPIFFKIFFEKRLTSTGGVCYNKYAR